MKSDAYKQGVEARFNNVTYGSCNYQLHTQERRDWQHGFQAADIAIKALKAELLED